MLYFPVPPMPIDGDVFIVMDTNAFATVAAAPSGVWASVVLPRPVFEELRPRGAIAAARSAVRILDPHHVAGSHRGNLVALRRRAERRRAAVVNAGSMSNDMAILLCAERPRQGFTRLLTLDLLLWIVAAHSLELRQVAWPTDAELDAMGLIPGGTGGFAPDKRSMLRPILPVPSQCLVVLDYAGFVSAPWPHLQRCCEAQHVCVCVTLQAWFEIDRVLKVERYDTDLRRRCRLLQKTLTEAKLHRTRSAFRRARDATLRGHVAAGDHFHFIMEIVRDFVGAITVVASNANASRVARSLGWRSSTSMNGCVQTDNNNANNAIFMFW